MFMTNEPGTPIVANFTSLNDVLKQCYRPFAVEELLDFDEAGRIVMPVHEPGVRYGHVCMGCGAVEFDTDGTCTYCRRQS